MPRRAQDVPRQLEGCTPAELAELTVETNPRCFALRVRGDVLRAAHVLDGDLVLMEFRAPYHGAIVAALIDGECVLRRYWIEGARAYLHSADGTDPGEKIPAEELVIQGVLRAVVRHVGHAP